MKAIRAVSVLLLFSAAAAFAQGAPKVEVYKNANCGCWVGWVELMREMAKPTWTMA